MHFGGLAATLPAAGALVASSASPETINLDGLPLPTIVLSLVSAFALWRAGSVRAWKSTAEARDARIRDLERENGELRTELAIPERIEGIIKVMADTSKQQDARLEQALVRLETAANARHELVLQALADRAA